MTIKARDYIAKLPESEQAAIKAEAQKLIAEELTLAELREARRRSQAELAKSLACSNRQCRGSSGAPTCI